MAKRNYSNSRKGAYVKSAVAGALVIGAGILAGCESALETMTKYFVRLKNPLRPCEGGEVVSTNMYSTTPKERGWVPYGVEGEEAQMNLETGEGDFHNTNNVYRAGFKEIYWDTAQEGTNQVNGLRPCSSGRGKGSSSGDDDDDDKKKKDDPNPPKSDGDGQNTAFIRINGIDFRDYTEGRQAA